MRAMSAGIHGADIGRPEQAYAFLDEQRGVARLVARIGCKILIGAELRWIDENRRDGMVGDAPAHADEREMAVVQRHHRRDQRADLPPLLQCRTGPGPHRAVQDDLPGPSPSAIFPTIYI